MSGETAQEEIRKLENTGNEEEFEKGVKDIVDKTGLKAKTLSKSDKRELSYLKAKANEQLPDVEVQLPDVEAEVEAKPKPQKAAVYITKAESDID